VRVSVRVYVCSCVGASSQLKALQNNHNLLTGF
jgi:hypothetical protein